MTNTLASVVAATTRAVQRFPLVVVASIVAAAGSIVAVHGDHPEADRLVVVATLALPLFFAVTVLTERFGRSASRWLPMLVANLVLYGVWRAWPGWTTETGGLRYLQLSLAFHAFVACAPFMQTTATNGFWQYNKALFLRFLTAALYTGVLYIGLAIALKAIDTLLKIDVAAETYLRLWCILAFVFNTCVFLGGVPDDIATLEDRTDYPGGLRAFTQFVLVPLVAIYLAILMLYLGKVVITQEWPNGWIGYLVSSVAVVGILAWLLMHPLEERPEYRWVKLYTRGFYIALMPAIVMLWLAIWKRAHQYGITEPRYILIVLSVWLAAVALYYTFAKSRNIKLIPASLGVLALATFAGPTGAYAVSRKSQFDRLQAVLGRDALLTDGRLQRRTREVSDSDAVAITAGIRYLLERHGYESIAAWLPDSLRRKFATDDSNPSRRFGDVDGHARAIMASMNVPFSLFPKGPGPKDGGEYINFSAGYWPATIPIADFTHEVEITPYLGAAPNDTITVDAHTVVRVSRENATIHVLRDGQSVLDMPMRAAIDSAAAVPQSNRPGEPRQATLRISASGGGIAATLYLTSAQGTDQDGNLKLTAINGELLLKIPR